MKRDIAIEVKNVSKKFKIPHEKIDTMRSIFVNIFSKKTYEEFKALDDVSFKVKKGETFGIIGRNGSGKSTLLKILSGVYRVDEGEVNIDGKISPFLELGIGFNPELSGRDNIFLNATILGLNQKEIKEKFDHILEFSEIGRFIDQKVKNYSSGMKGRLAFSVAIHADREILLMDEVMAVGDMRFKDKCLDVFENFKKQGKTIVLVNHSPEVIRVNCDNAMVLDGGKVMAVGDPDEVMKEYERIVNV
ncbi:MAG: ABC transporter ATP-binding protein [Candidatus Moranbacteria bacterium]|nr:ABC transporter ATP-binding protein [Candidatus Moranbacteria bacterium]